MELKLLTQVTVGQAEPGQIHFLQIGSLAASLTFDESLVAAEYAYKLVGIHCHKLSGMLPGWP